MTRIESSINRPALPLPESPVAVQRRRAPCLVFNLAHGALAKAKVKPPRTFKEAKIADEMARKACGLDDRTDYSDCLHSIGHRTISGQ
jgi:hypothetical protein